RHPPVLGALMLDEKPHEHLAAAAKARMKHEIAEPLAQHRVHEVGGRGRERGPVDALGHRRQKRAQQTTRLRRIAKYGLEEAVVKSPRHAARRLVAHVPSTLPDASGRTSLPLYQSG